MKKLFANGVRKALIALLCVVMTFSSLPITAYAAVTGSKDDAIEVVQKKSDIAQISASLDSAQDRIAVSKFAESSEPVQTVTKRYAYTKETVPRYNVRYVIMHEATGNIMSYKATEPTSPATSITYNQDGNADNSYFFATDVQGNIDESTLYIDHSDRDAALWLLRQDINYNYGTGDENGKQIIKDLDPLSHWSNIHTNTPMSPFLTPGGIRYHHAFFFKGTGSEWNENGTVKTSNNGAYWYSVVGQDGNNVQERFLRLFPTHEDMYGLSDVNTQIEPQEDGSFIVFRRDTSTTPTTYNMLTCDGEGNWKTEVVEGIDDTNRDKYKISLYRYFSVGEYKKVNYKGYQTYDVVAGTTEEQVLSAIAQNITVMNVTDKNFPVPCSADTGKVGYYWLEFGAEFDSSASRAQSFYNVNINYRNDDGSDTRVGAVSVCVHDEIPVAGTSVITNLNGTIPQNKSEGYIVQQIIGDENINATFSIDVRTEQGIVVKTVPITVGMLSDSNGNAIDTSQNGVFEKLTVTYLGEKITGNFTLTVDDSDEALNYPVYPEEGSVNVTKTGKEVGKFKETGVANINLSATGMPLNKGVDMIVVMDLSGSMKYGVTNTVRVNESNSETSRLFALQESLKAMITTLKDSNVDFRIAMSDFGDIDSYEFDNAVVDKKNPAKFFFDSDLDGYWDQKGEWPFGARREFYNHLNYVHSKYGADVTDDEGNVIVDNDNRAMPYNVYETKYEKALLNYTGKIIPNIYTGSHTVSADAFVNVDTFDDAAIQKLLSDVAENQTKSLGTNYDVGLEYAYQLGHAIQQSNIANGEDRDIICVFMSDGAAMQYNYFSGRATNQSWADWLSGDIEYNAFQHNVPSDASASPALIQLMDDMLTKFKKGTLENPKYGVRETVFNASGERNTNNASELLAPKEVTDEETKEVTLYFDFSAVDISAETTFESAMNKIGVGLHWEILDRIAKANGLKGYVCAADVEADLLALAKADMLKYPTDEAQFYPQYTGTATDFFEAMNELDINCDWELFVQIVLSNVSDGRLDDVYEELTTLGEGMKWGTLSPYYYFYNEEGKNWFAEAIKGSRNTLYPVVNKHAFSNNTDVPFAYYGDVRNKFSTGTGMELDGKDYISGFVGLDIPIYTVGLSLCTEGYLTEQIAKNVLVNISSGSSYAFTANNKEELIDVFNAISSSSAVAATGAYFVDKMGPEFDLYTRKNVVNGSGETVTIEADPVIRVLEYTLDENHKRTGTPIVYETVTFTEDQSGNMIVQSDKVYNTIEDSSGNLIQEYPSILQSDGVIKAKYFFYNTNKYIDENNTGTVGIDLTGDGKDDWQLEAETFFWIIGPIGKTEIVLDYQVYLTGSMEGEREGEHDVYETNTSAKLNYVNYLSNNCSKDTVSPAFPWPNPFVGYAFYLVDELGNPLNANGDISTFTDSYKVTAPEYIEMILNSAPNVILPEDKFTADLSLVYELYDPSVSYEVVINSDNSGHWRVDKDSELKDSTYITNYGGAPTNKNSSELTDDTVAYDRTVVWFAVMVKKVTRPDTIVVDYGLPVQANVLENDDNYSTSYSLHYVGDTASVEDDYEASKENYTKLSLDQYLSAIPLSDNSVVNDTEFESTYGKVEIVGDTDLKYTLNTSNGMQISEEEVFVYSAYATGKPTTHEGKGYRYSTLTVIPATSIYYEDNFLTYNVMDHDTGTAITPDHPRYDDLCWVDKGEAVKDSQQAQDRPGDFTTDSLDADNIYGYDDAYTQMNLYSLGSSKMINVGSHVFEDGSTCKTRATAEFTFSGTGFDIVSLTSNTTGSIVIAVSGISAEGEKVRKNYLVDTYYGYAWDGENWVVDTEADSALYQIPVMKVKDLPYGKYDVTINVTYAELFDHQQYGDAGNFDFYLDAIRIYDPANDGKNSDVIKDAYVADKEGWPAYEELRNLILKAESFGTIEDNQVVNGAVYIDNTKADAQTKPSISDYHNYGPNNEVYLAPGQAVAFELDGTDVERIHIALKSVSGKSANVKIFDASLNCADIQPMAINTATDLYYDITPLAGKVVVIYNCSQSTGELISVTNIKTTYASDPGADANVANNVRMSKNVAMLALRALESVPAEEPVIKTGPVKIEITGGTGFSISIDGSVPRPQGPAYLNSRVTIGSKVTVTANTSSTGTFIGWVNPLTGIIVSPDLEFTFTASGNDFYRALFSTEVEGVQMVMFVNDKSGSYGKTLDMQYYSADDKIEFPADPTQVGFDFAGWSMTEAEIKSAIAAGKDVEVVAKWTRQIVPVQVTVNGGEGSGSYNANSAVTVVANAAPAGMKFAYWMDAKGNIKSYSTQYKFFPSVDTVVTAVFVEESTKIDYQVLVGVDSIDTATIAEKNVFYYSWYCPEEYTFIKAGIVAVNKDNYNEETFTAGSADSNVYDRSPSGTNLIPVNNFSWTKSNVTPGQTWVAKAYVQYKNAQGNIITVYSDTVEATKE